MKKTKLSIYVVAFVLFFTNLSAATTEELEARIIQLEKLLQQQMRQNAQQAEKIETVEKKVTHVSETAKSASVKKSNKQYGVELYGRFWPRLTFRDEDNQTSTDVTDATSRVGIKGSVDLTDSTHGIFPR